ncbi:hypothetical protein JW721_04435 [Candidatus Micrarchaeota archaeon]|nr:hypothetical protein [Candidatus Micrarchaeota archaeon]
MSMHKKPLLQKQDAAGARGAGKPRMPKSPLGEECNATEKTRATLHGIRDGLNAKLFAAANRGFLWDAEDLLRAGAEINAVNKEGKSVLDVAKESGNPALTSFLRERGAKSANELG